MRIENWLVPGIWLALLLSLGILLYANARNNALLEGNDFSLRNGKFAVLTVKTDNQQRVTITLRKRFTAGEHALLTAVAAYSATAVFSTTNSAALNANTYQLQLPLESCEFSTGRLVDCDNTAISAAAPDQFYAISWWQDAQPLLWLTSQQLSKEGLKISFRTSRERKSVRDTTGQMKSHCILQAHLQIGVYKSLQQNASMTVEDVFFPLSDQACVA